MSNEVHLGERIAKRMARAGLCSRRDAEMWITAGRVSVNGKKITSPALNVTEADKIVVNGENLEAPAATRLWLYHKPRGILTTTRDDRGRPTVFDYLPPELPRVVTVGRLDFNSEGLLLLTNDGAFSKWLTEPATGWLRKYKVRAYGHAPQAMLDKLANGVKVEGVQYGAIDAQIDRQQGDNLWLTMGIREGKNREIRRVLEYLDLQVNRLIRLSFGPFQLGELPECAAKEINGKILKDQCVGYFKKPSQA